MGFAAIRIPIEATLGIARRALGTGGTTPEGATRAPERRRATSAKPATPPRKRAAAKPKPTTTKAEARTTKAKAKPSPKPRPVSSTPRNGAQQSTSERAEASTEARREGQPRQAKPGEAVSGFPEPPGKDPGDVSKDPTPYHALSNPVDDPDSTEWPDPYERREDPRDPPDPDGRPFGEEPHPGVGSTSTSEPHPSADPEARDRAEAPQRDRLDD